MRQRPKHRPSFRYAKSCDPLLRTEKPLPEKVWQSVKKAAGIEGTFVPPKGLPK